MVWAFDKSESSYSAEFPQSAVRIIVEGDDFAKDDKGADILSCEYLPLKEGNYYHFELSDHKCRLSQKSSFVHKPASHGSIAPGTAVGYGRLYLEGSESPELSLGVEVASEVISYKKDYQELLQQLTEDIADLQMQCTSNVQGLVGVNEWTVAKNDVQQLFFLLGLVGNAGFDAAIRQIVERPQVQLVEVEYETDIRRASRIGRNELRQFASASRRVELPSELKGRYSSLTTVPERLVATRRVESADTLENQFVKYVLNTFLERLQTFRRTLQEKRKDESALAVMVDLDAAIKMLSRWTAHEFFKGIGPLLRMPTASVVLQRREGYREVLKKWLQLQAGATLKTELSKDIYAANQRKMSALYEYWCFFRLLKIVARIFNIGSAELSRKMFEQVGTAADGLSLTLKEGKTTTLEGSFETQVENIRYRSLKVEFAYNRTFSAKGEFGRQPSWTLPMRPDYTLTFWPASMTQEIARLNDLVTYVHFDAKYKAEDLKSSLGQIGAENESAQGEEFVQEDDAQAKRDVKRVDILKMHAYRDAIRQTGGAYVLFPGCGVKNKPLQQSVEVLPGLGAFMMSPAHESTREITEFLLNVARHLCDRITRWENFTYQKNLIYSGSKDEWAKHQKAVAERYAFAKGLLDSDNGPRVNLSDRGRLASIPPNHFLYTNIGEGPKGGPRGRWFQAKWIKDRGMFIKSTGQDLKGAIPEDLVMIVALWMPPFSMMVKRYRGTMTRAAIETQTGEDLPFGGSEFHVWDVSLHNFNHVDEYLAKHPYGPGSDIEDKGTLCQTLHDQYGGNWTWTDE